MSGFMVEPTYQLDRYAIIPVQGGSKFYYVFHPVDLIPEANSTYYKHVLPKFKIYIPKSVAVKEWIVKTQAAAAPTVEAELPHLEEDLGTDINLAEPWNKYAMYTKFSKKTNQQ